MYEVQAKCRGQMILLLSYPRSGNTFVRQVLKEAFGTNSYSIYPGEYLTEHYGGWINAENVEELPVVFVKSHKKLKNWQGLVWHIVRDGRDAVVSLRKWNRNPTSGRGNEWSQHVQLFESLANHTTKFEDLIDNPIGTVQAGIDSLGLSDVVRRTGETLTPFSELQASNGEMWREGHTGGWVYQMPDVAEFMSENRQAMQEMNYA